MTLPSVHAIVLNWNGLADTLECLSGLHEQTYTNLKVHVVDNGSLNDEAGQIARRFPQINLIRQKENSGFCEGNNIGMRAALKEGADFVLLLNNDTVVPADLVTQLVGSIRELNQVGAVSPLILYNSDRNVVWYAGAKWRPENAAFDLNPDGWTYGDAVAERPFATQFACGCCMLIPASVIEKVGFFDERYFAYFDEADWCARMKQLGLISYVIPSAIIYHKVSGSSSSAIRAYLLSRNRLFWMKKYLPILVRLKSLPFLVRELLWNITVLIYLKLGRRGLAVRANSEAMLTGWVSYCLNRTGKWSSRISALDESVKRASY